ncbi:MAG: twin transmembrane helix small protein [Alphaproteobacteria bacterium]|nr:twin transmembrane helix small protein [Alphaproteobacteria bacterium]MDE1986064.1 twin transmembrane helix small protein [Alphaproteobacteria bacterium]MDE2264394.1 twin transmembrane helix small protein [Alphaproteobacteria bacterium]
MIGKILILVALAVVAIVLLAGIVVMAIGGKTSSRWSNVLMRYRIVAQAAALLVIGLVAYLASNH